MSDYLLRQRASRNPSTIASMKARQSAKISEIAQTLTRLGITSVDDLAQALGLARSTAWTILRATHKSSGLSPTIIARMLISDSLPASARETIIEYVEERSVGLYGHGKIQQHRFIATLTARLAERQNYAKLAPLQPHAEIENASLCKLSGEPSPLDP